jgi:hypothetical protein
MVQLQQTLQVSRKFLSRDEPSRTTIEAQAGKELSPGQFCLVVELVEEFLRKKQGDEDK